MPKVTQFSVTPACQTSSQFHSLKHGMYVAFMFAEESVKKKKSKKQTVKLPYVTVH